MSFKIGSGGGSGDFEKPDLGRHVAVLADIVDIGEQKTNYLIEKGPNKGQPKNTRQAVLFWELAQRNQEGEFAGHRFIKTQTVTASLYGGWNQGSPAKLFGICTALNNGVPLTEADVEDEYDISAMVGKSAMIYLEDTEDGKYRFIGRVESLQNAADALTAEEQYGEAHYHDWLKDKIAARVDQPSTLPPPMADAVDSEASPYRDDELPL